MIHLFLNFYINQEPTDFYTETMSSTVAGESSDHHDRPVEDITLVDGLPASTARTLANTKDNETGESFNRGASNKPEERDKLENKRDETIKKGHEVII